MGYEIRRAEGWVSPVLSTEISKNAKADGERAQIQLDRGAR